MILKQGLQYTRHNVFRPGEQNFERVHEQASAIVEKVEDATDIFLAGDNGPHDRDQREGFVEFRGFRTDSGIYSGRLNSKGEIRYRHWESDDDFEPELGASAIGESGAKQYHAIHLLEGQPDYTFLQVEPKTDGSIETEEGEVTLNYLLFWDNMTSNVEKYRPGSWS